MPEQRGKMAMNQFVAFFCNSESGKHVRIASQNSEYRQKGEKVFNSIMELGGNLWKTAGEQSPVLLGIVFDAAVTELFLEESQEWLQYWSTAELLAYQEELKTVGKTQEKVDELMLRKAKRPTRKLTKTQFVNAVVADKLPENEAWNEHKSRSMREFVDKYQKKLLPKFDQWHDIAKKLQHPGEDGKSILQKKAESLKAQKRYHVIGVHGKAYAGSEGKEKKYLKRMEVPIPGDGMPQVVRFDPLDGNVGGDKIQATPLDLMYWVLENWQETMNNDDYVSDSEGSKEVDGTANH